MKTALSALSGLFVALALCASPARAAVEHVGSCTDPTSTACVLGDGSFEYLSVGGATGTAALTQRLGEGWELGSRRDFLDMVLRNSPTFTAAWNDVILGNGTVAFGTAEVLGILASARDSVSVARSGDPLLGAAFSDIILKFGGIDANPAYLLTLGTADLLPDDKRAGVTLAAYYTDAGESITRNDTVSGPGSTNGWLISSEPIVERAYFLMRPAAPVPEPSAWAMLLGGGVAVALASRRRRARS